MRCEVIAIGTELLLGTTVDSNSAWIGGQLADAGIDCLRSIRVGDNHERMVACIRESLERADAVICCGGLGPTQDDVTREAIAEVMGVGLVRDDSLAEVIRDLFAARNRRMPENNLRQCDVPEGATVIPQTRGTAPGLICPVGDQVVYAVPGVPHEMRDMVERAVVPDLRARSGETSTIVHTTLRTWGESESSLAEILQPRIEALDAAAATGDAAATIAYNASGIEGIKIRIAAKGTDEATARAVVAAEEAEIRTLLGDLVFGVDDQTMEAAVGDLLLARGWTLGLAESLTGGLVSSRCVDVPGCSDWFRGSVVSYASEVKFDLLDVPEGPVVSEETAAAMASAARRVLGADVGLGVTGVAGPDEQDGQPVGTVFIASDLAGDVEVRRLGIPGDRARIRQFSVISLMDSLRRRLLALG